MLNEQTQKILQNSKSIISSGYSVISVIVVCVLWIYNTGKENERRHNHYMEQFRELKNDIKAINDRKTPDRVSNLEHEITINKGENDILHMRATNNSNKIEKTKNILDGHRVEVSEDIYYLKGYNDGYKEGCRDERDRIRTYNKK